MRDIEADLTNWHLEGKPFALATVVRTWGSAPRQVGANMGVNIDGEITGSVSGGCVEGAVVEAGIKAIKTNQPKLLHFSVADETAWEIGLACGGEIDVFVQPIKGALWENIQTQLMNESTFIISMVISGSEQRLGQTYLSSYEEGLLPNSNRDKSSQEILELFNASTQPKQSKTEAIVVTENDLEIFHNIISAPPTLLIIGGVQIAIALASIAKTLGYITVIIDPRKSFGNTTRFPEIDHLIQAWPEKAFGELDINATTAITTLTHDPKIDDPALIIALKSPAFYVGALGSKKTHTERCKRLIKAGLSTKQVDKIKGPIGLDIGAKTPEEIALSILAEITSIRRA